jgi:hypothetical protein
MTIPFGHLRLTITLTRAPAQCTTWEEYVAIGMDDLALAQLNQRNVRDPEGAPWAGLPMIYGGARRP